MLKLTANLFRFQRIASILALLAVTAAGPANAQFFDDFDRADSAAIGNGWLERNPVAFEIVGNEVSKQPSSGGYRDTVVYRPASEDLLDEEASFEFTLTSGAPGFPQILTRLQSNTVATGNVLDGYMIYVNNSNTTAVLGRQRGSAFVTSLAQINISPALNTTDTYRLRLRSTGTNPVELAGFVERMNAGGWEVIGQATFSDASGARIESPGSAGFGGFREASYNFDNFERVDLGGASNPVPTTNAIAPNSATEGGSAFNLTVTGANFVPGATVRWNGADRTTTFVSAGELQAAITAADIAAAGSASVTVFNPTPGGGASNAQTFTIDPLGGGDNPVPATAGLAPSSATEGGTAFNLTVTGSDFVPGATVRWNGADRTTTFVSAGELQAAITAADIAAAGAATVTVFNPAPGGGTSNSQTFTIDPASGDNPVPATTGLAPSSAIEGGSAFNLTVTGSDFVPGATVRWNGADRATTFVSAGELQATVTAADIATAGAASVTVFNPAPGGGTSNAQTFTIDPDVPQNPLPSTSGLTPSSATAGDPAFTLTVQGADFIAGSVVRWNGSNRPTTFISANELQADITAADLSVAGSAAVSVFNPAPGGGTSNTQSFAIASNGTGFFDDFNRGNSPDVGNGWLERNPTAFEIAAGEVVKQPSVGGYRDTLVYRPASEDLLDEEAAFEFRLVGGNPGFPQILTRVQSDTVAIGNVLDGYIIYINNSTTTAVLGRQTGSSFVSTLATITMSPALNTTDTYRLRLRSTGTDPVELAAFVERLDSGNWQIIGQASYSDTAPNRIATPGSAGFGGFTEASYVFDNFYRTDLGTGSNPLPSTTGLAPSNATEGGSAFNLTVTGSSFVPGSTVRWNGADRATTFVSSGELQATVTAADIAVAGSASVTVFSPAPGGGTSNAQTFTIDASGGGNNPVPATASLAPTSATEGGSAFSLTVLGSDFVPGSIVRWNGADRATTFISAGELQAAISAADIAVAGSASVSVFNPAPGGGTSNQQTFTIDPAGGGDNPVPATSGLTPNSAVEGGSAFSLTVQGSDFVPGAIVRWGGADRTTTFVSAGELQAAITAADIATAGSASVTVFNPVPGGGVSNAQTFTIDPSGPQNPLPEMSGLSPQGVGVGDGAFTLTVLGNGFTNQSTVLWNNQPRPTTYVSGQLLEADISAADVQTAEIATVTVSTPAPGGGISNPYPFFVSEPSAGYFFDDFNTPDSPDIGNSWVEKYPNAFSIANNSVVGIQTPTNIVYRDSIVYRPLAEDRSNVHVGMEYVKTNDPSFPQVHARAARATLTDPDTLNSYILFVDDFLPGSGGLVLAVGPDAQGVEECFLTQVNITEQIDFGERYRLRLIVRGTNPVELEGYLDHFDNGIWQTITTTTATHSDTTPTPPYFCGSGTLPPPINGAGAIGFSKWWRTPDVYDNFYWLELDTTAPVPGVSSLAPNFAEAGDPGVDILVSGSGFVPASVVRWNGADRPTTYISASSLQASLTAADLAAIGNGTVTVFNPAPGGGLSNGENFDIVPPGTGSNPVPQLDNLTPANAVAGSGSTAVTITGSGFVTGSVVRWNGVDLATTYVSPTTLQVTASAGLLATPGDAIITVFNPSPNGGTSELASFVIVATGDFVDSFGRANSGTMGNGWIEKAPQAFSIVDNELFKNQFQTGYRNMTAYRPPAEDATDGETSVEMRMTLANPPGFPQIFTRLQQATAGIPNRLDGYMMYFNNNPTQILISRQVGLGLPTTLTTINLAQPLDTSSTYRMRLRATGTNPVVVEGFFEVLTASGFVEVASASANDASANRITTPGAAAIGGYIEQAYIFDQFVARDLD